MNAEKLADLLRDAADVIAENAEELKAAHTTDEGDWCEDEFDQGAREDYEREIDLAAQLRAAADQLVAQAEPST